MDNQLIIIFTLLVAVFIWLVFLTIQFFILKKGLKDLFGDHNSQTIEKALNDYVKKVKKYFDDVEELKNFSQKLYLMSSMGLQKVGVVRFNPFGDVGGDQSFSVALLNFENSGIVITSLYSREGNKVYSKPILGGISKHHLAEEEKEAIEKAIKDYKKGV